jgi:hypothetical protein
MHYCVQGSRFAGVGVLPGAYAPIRRYSRLGTSDEDKVLPKVPLSLVVSLRTKTKPLSKVKRASALGLELGLYMSAKKIYMAVAAAALGKKGK